jgi:hypothetical protein
MYVLLINIGCEKLRHDANSKAKMLGKILFDPLLNHEE